VPLLFNMTALPFGNAPEATKFDVLPPAGRFVRLAALPFGASTSVPITNPRFVRAALSLDAPVPPFAIARSDPDHVELSTVVTVGATTCQADPL